MNGFDALQQLVAEAASTRKMIEQIQASIGYKAMAQQLAEASSTRKMIEQIQASIGYKAVAQQLAEASSISRLLAAGAARARTPQVGRVSGGNRDCDRRHDGRHHRGAARYGCRRHPSGHHRRRGVRRPP